MRCSAAAALAWLCAASASAQDTPAERAPRIELVTFGRGDHVNEYFGHNAFVLSVPHSPALVFNYGMFSFGPDMIPRFLTGRLTFWVGATDFERSAAQYVAANRDVRLRRLNLEPEQRLAIAQQLAHDVQPEYSHYLYDHYFDNCSTRVRDVLDRALHGQLREAWSRPGRFTLRELTRRYTQHDRLTEWLMMFALNDRVDRPLRQWDEVFLPDELEQRIDEASYVDSQGRRVPLVSERRDYFRARRPPPPAAPVRRWPELLGLGALLGLTLAALARLGLARRRGRGLFVAAATSFGLAGGALGALSSELWAFSDHVVAYHSENLLLLNPLTLLAGCAGVFALSGSARAERALYACACALGASTLVLLALHPLLPAFDQDISLPLSLLAPINLGFACGSLQRLRASRARAGADAAAPEAQAERRGAPQDRAADLQALPFVASGAGRERERSH